MLYVNYISIIQRKKLSPYEYPLVPLFITELIIFSQPYSFSWLPVPIKATTILLGIPAWNFSAVWPPTFKVHQLRRSITHTSPPLHVHSHSSHSPNSCYLNFHGLLSKPTIIFQFAVSIQVVDSSCVTLHKAQLLSYLPPPIQESSTAPPANSIKYNRHDMAWHVINRPSLIFHQSRQTARPCPNTSSVFLVTRLHLSTGAVPQKWSFPPNTSISFICIAPMEAMLV